MLQEEKGVLEGETAGLQKSTLVAVVICAALCVFFINTGLLSLFYLAPLGYAVLTCGSIWLPFLAAAGANALVSIIARFIFPGSSGSLWVEIFYFTALFLCFAWIIGGSKLTRMRTAYRFILASAAGTAAFLIFVLGSSRDSVFNAMLLDMAEMFSSVVVSSNGADAVRQSALQMILTPENILEMSKMILLRGGAIFSIFLLFFVNRYIAILAVRLIKKQRNERGLIEFFAPSQTIWALSGSIALILMARLIKMDLLDIIAWNVLVVCAILFLAQGAGIFIYFLSRRTNAFRFFINILIILVIISPGLNTVAIAALLLLGIAENWVPFRAPKQEAPTPGP
jgi:hypothetical protein